jgi:hypothetical protein
MSMVKIIDKKTGEVVQELIRWDGEISGFAMEVNTFQCINCTMDDWGCWINIVPARGGEAVLQIGGNRSALIVKKGDFLLPFTWTNEGAPTFEHADVWREYQLEEDYPSSDFELVEEVSK